MSFADSSDPQGPRRSRFIAWAVTAIMAATVCYSVLGVPLQVTDSLVPMLDAQRIPSVAAAFAAGATDAGYFRPLRMVIVVFALFLLVLEVNSRARVAALLFALTVLMGLHTFRGTVWEAYPVNHSLEVVVFCLLALVLSRSKGGRWVDIAASLTFLAAAFTVESGLLVWVVIVAARLTGARGISRRALLVVTLLAAGYLALRFGYLRTGVPALSERSSGFGLRQVGPDELQRRFGAWPYGFYAYNVVSSILTVLFSEPRAGIWTIPAEIARGRIAAGTIVNVVSSIVTTAAIGSFVATRARLWRRLPLERDDQLVCVSLAVIAANAVISYGYTKDEIMGPAGAFYARSRSSSRSPPPGGSCGPRDFTIR